jgi:hypothetical protein
MDGLDLWPKYPQAMLDRASRLRAALPVIARIAAAAAARFALHRWARIGIALFAMSISTTAVAQPASEASPTLAPPGTALQIVGESSLVVDPACNAIAGAQLMLILRNPATSGNPVALALRAEHLTADPKGPLPSATVTIEPTGDRILPTTLGPSASIPIAVVANGFLGPGTWSTDLYNEQTSLGAVHFLVADPLAHLSLQAGDPNQPTVTLTRDRTASFLLRNDYPSGYEVAWEYSLKDAPASPEVTGQLGIPANDTAVLTLRPPDAWFSDASTFRDAVTDGYLRVQLRPRAGCQAAPQPPGKLFSVATTLVGYSPRMKAACTYSATFAMLILGALCSLYVNYKVPDERIRRALRKELKDLQKDIDGLPGQLASRLRVVVGVECQSLSDQLASLNWLNTDFEATRSRIDAMVKKLKRRVDVLARMGELRVQYEGMLSGKIPPSILHRFEDLFERTVLLLAILDPPDARMNAATANLDAIEAGLDDWSQPDVKPPQDLPLATQIVARLTSLNEDLTRGRVDVAAWKVLSPQVPGLDHAFDEQPPAPTALEASDYADKDWVGSVGSLLRDYCHLCDQRKPPANDPIQARQVELIVLLRKRTWIAHLAARRLLAEMTAGIYAENIDAEIRAERLDISLENNSLRRFEPGWFGLAFQNGDYRAAQAREEWVPEWNFGHVPAGHVDDPQHYLKESGWSVAHYFPEAKSYTVTVNFRRTDGTSPASPLQRTQVVSVGEVAGRGGAKMSGPIRSVRRWFATNGDDVMSLVVALGAAVLALSAGAKDQLLKMETFFGLITVFGLGFASNQVRTLLSKKGDSPPP